MSASIYNADCITGMKEHLAADSVDLVVTSPPFGQLFMYSGKIEDVGNNQDGRDMRASRFGLHMRFFVEQLFRVLKPGCNACIHIQQLLKYKNEHGWAGRRDFRGAIIDIFEYGGFEYVGEVAIPKNPQIIAQRLKLHSLQFATGKRHSARKLAPAVNDYVIVFQKPGEAEPVLAIHDSVENPSGWVTAGNWISYAHGVWFNENKTYHFNNTAYVEQGLDALFDENLKLDGFAECYRWWLEHEWLASGIWDDIRETDVLEGRIGLKQVREKNDEKHVCPLQLDVIRRFVKLYSNPGELVLDPYMGIGSTAYVAIEQGRRAFGFELKESYFHKAVKNANSIARQKADEAPLFASADENRLPLVADI